MVRTETHLTTLSEMLGLQYLSIILSHSNILPARQKKAKNQCHKFIRCPTQMHCGHVCAWTTLFHWSHLINCVYVTGLYILKVWYIHNERTTITENWWKVKNLTGEILIPVGGNVSNIKLYFPMMQLRSESFSPPVCHSTSFVRVQQGQLWFCTLIVQMSKECYFWGI